MIAAHNNSRKTEVQLEWEYCVQTMIWSDSDPTDSDGISPINTRINTLNKISFSSIDALGTDPSTPDYNTSDL